MIAQTASQQVFAIPELTILILSYAHFSARELFSLRRINPFFHNLIPSVPSFRDTMYLPDQFSYRGVHASAIEFHISNFWSNEYENRESHVNNIIFQPGKTFFCRGLFSRMGHLRWTFHHSVPTLRPWMTLMTDPLKEKDRSGSGRMAEGRFNPVLCVDLSTDGEIKRAREERMQSWREMEVMQPGTMLTLRVYVDSRRDWRIAEVDVQPGTVGKIIEIALLVVEAFDLATRMNSKRRWGPGGVMKSWRWPRRVWRSNERDNVFPVRRLIYMMTSRPKYWDVEDMLVYTHDDGLCKDEALLGRFIGASGQYPDVGTSDWYRNPWQHAGIYITASADTQHWDAYRCCRESPRCIFPIQR